MAQRIRSRWPLRARKAPSEPPSASMATRMCHTRRPRPASQTAREALQLPRHHTHRLDRGFEVWVMTCAPEELPDATPTGHRVGVEDAESDREDCERRAWRPLTRDTLSSTILPFLDFTHTQFFLALYAVISRVGPPETATGGQRILRWARGHVCMHASIRLLRVCVCSCSEMGWGGGGGGGGACC